MAAKGKTAEKKAVEPEEKVTGQKEGMKNNYPGQENADPRPDGEGKDRGHREPEYLAAELAEHAGRLFGVRKECVVAALQAENVTSCTLSGAKGIVQKFMKEVK